MKAKALIFDKDGTLIHYDASWAPYPKKLFEILAPDQQDVWSAMGLAVGYDFETGKFASGSMAVNGTFKDILAIMEGFIGPVESDAALAADKEAQQDCTPHPVGNLNGLLTEFRAQGRKLAVATNDLIHATERQLKIMENRALFDAVYCADSGPTPKPSGDMIRAACSEMGVAPSEAIMVGDSSHDLHAGRDAGIGWNVGVLTGPATREEIVDLADLVLDDIHQLPDHLS